jgi:prevent-host-death family protein
MQDFIPISEARANLPDLVNAISEGASSTTITVNGKPKVVLISFEELEAIKETAEILAEPGALKSIKKSMKEVQTGELIDLNDITL